MKTVIYMQGIVSFLPPICFLPNGGGLGGGLMHKRTTPQNLPPRPRNCAAHKLPKKPNSGKGYETINSQALSLPASARHRQFHCRLLHTEQETRCRIGREDHHLPHRIRRHRAHGVLDHERLHGRPFFKC